jgi:pimeloyl-ACP methyl ester carboxylesterase
MKPDKPAASRVTKIEGKRVHYLTAGQGPALILLHGYTQTSRMWRPLIDKLKDKFTVIAPDLPGIGDSDIPKVGIPGERERDSSMIPNVIPG